MMSTDFSHLGGGCFMYLHKKPAHDEHRLQAFWPHDQMTIVVLTPVQTGPDGGSEGRCSIYLCEKQMLDEH